MSNYSTLKAAISAVIKENNNHEITGQVLQTTLLAMVDSLAGGYLFKGIATPATVVGTPDENVFYIGGGGLYSNFGATPVHVPDGCIGIFTYNGSFENHIIPTGGVFDISAYNAVGGTPATYANLQAALGTNGANIPEALRKGGMSVKFIQGSAPSSDNNYIQARLMADEFTTDITQWQGVDDVPTAGSKNMVYSNGVANNIILCNTMLDGDGNAYYEPSDDVAHSPFLAKDSGMYRNWGVAGSYYVTPFIPCHAFSTMHFHGLENSDTALCVQYDKDKNEISGTVVNGTANETDKDITINKNAYFIRFCGRIDYGLVISVNGSNFKEAYRQEIVKLIEDILSTQATIDNAIGSFEKKILLSNVMLDGDGNEYYEGRGDVAHSPFLAKNTGNYRNYNISGSYYVTPFIPCYGCSTLHFHGLENSDTALCVQYDKDKNEISGTVVNGTANETDKDITINSGAFFIRFCGDIGAGIEISTTGSNYKEATRKVLQYLIETSPEEMVTRQLVDNTIEQGITSNPLATISCNAGLASIFHDWGFIGDSLSSGANYDKYGYQSSNIYAIYSYSWCQRLVSMIGNAIGSNWSVAGFTAKAWINRYWNSEQKAEYTTNGEDSYFKTDKKQAYCILLGTNDAAASVTLGDFATDVDLSDFNNNADTFIGNYAGIIQRIKSITPSAKIFVITCPTSSAAEANGYNAAIRDMVNHFTNVFLVDLKAYLPQTAEYIAAYEKDGHYTTQGYQYIAYAMATYIDYIVRQNPNAFKYVEIINTSFDDGTY